MSDSRLSNTADFIKKAKLIHGDKYDYSLVDYKRSCLKVKIICKRCGRVFEQRPNAHLMGCGCNICSRKDIYLRRVQKAASKFEEQAKRIHADKYDYSDVIYVDAKKTVTIKCKKCGWIFNQTPNNHLKGEGCPNCYGNARKGKEHFISRAKKIHGNLYDYTEVVYKNNRTPMKIRCTQCDRYFYQDAGNHLAGQGCPYCISSNGEKYIAKYFDTHGIKYEREYKFKDCKDKTYLPFDFYLKAYNLCVEFQGKQHYKEGFYFYTSYCKGDLKRATKLFETNKRHDAIKKQYCKEKGIKLLEIKYNEDVNAALDEFFKEYDESGDV